MRVNRRLVPCDHQSRGLFRAETATHTWEIIRACPRCGRCLGGKIPPGIDPMKLPRWYAFSVFEGGEFQPLLPFVLT
jgi:hypothetical protein